MAKLTLTDLANLQNENTAVAAINANNAAIETALENTLSRDGTSPNPMTSQLDMNSNQIINLGDSVSPSSPITKEEFDSAIAALSAVGHGDMFSANHLSEMVGHEAAAQANLGLTALLTTPLARLALMRDATNSSITYYVRTDGNDANTGLVNNAGGAKLTLQGAWNAASALDFKGNGCTIQVADGTYTSPFLISVPLTNASSILITGNTTTPANCILSCSTDDAIRIDGVVHPILIQGFFINTPGGTGGNCIALKNNSCVYLTNKMEFGFSSVNHIQVDGSVLIHLANYTISANTVGSHHHIIGWGQVGADGITVTLSGTPGWGAYYCGIGSGFASYTGATFSGAATGQRYFVHLNGSMKLAGVVLPGSIAGTSQGGNVDDESDLAILNHPTTPTLKFKVNAVEKASIVTNATNFICNSNSAQTQGMYIPLNTSAWAAVSDKRSKKDIETLDALSLLNDYRAVRYKEKINDRPQIGVIAQEQVTMFPEFVDVGSGDDDEEIDFSSENKWGVSYDRYGAVALQGVKQLHEIIKDLQDEIKELKKNA